MGSQSTTKTIFLLISMVGWSLVGAALMSLFPLLTNRLVSSDLTRLWMQNLSRSGYNLRLAWVERGMAVALTALGHIVWYQKFEGKRSV